MPTWLTILGAALAIIVAAVGLAKSWSNPRRVVRLTVEHGAIAALKYEVTVSVANRGQSGLSIDYTSIVALPVRRSLGRPRTAALTIGTAQAAPNRWSAVPLHVRAPGRLDR